MAQDASDAERRYQDLLREVQREETCRTEERLDRIEIKVDRIGTAILGDGSERNIGIAGRVMLHEQTLKQHRRGFGLLLAQVLLFLAWAANELYRNVTG